MEDTITWIISSIGAFFGVIIAYLLGIFTVLGTVIASVTTILMGLWATIVAFLTWALPASFISSISTLFAWAYPIVAKIAPFITVSKNGKKAISWLKNKYQIRKNTKIVAEKETQPVKTKAKKKQKTAHTPKIKEKSKSQSKSTSSPSKKKSA